jgi:FkbM family methyltransferase
MQIGPYQLKRCRYGWMLVTGPIIGKCLELYGQYSEDEVRIFRAFLKPGGVAIDVGANIGDLTVPMAQIAGPAGRVYAVESHSDMFNVLCANLAMNEIKNTKPINAFVADDDGVAMGGPWGEFGYVSKTWRPPVLSIDSLCLEHCDFIKIDVDGKEMEVLRSARGTIARLRPIIYLENDDRERWPAIFEFLRVREYDVFWHPAPIFEPDNFAGNRTNHWAPEVMVSLMMLCVPAERSTGVAEWLQPVASKDEWWTDIWGRYPVTAEGAVQLGQPPANEHVATGQPPSGTVMEP